MGRNESDDEEDEGWRVEGGKLRGKLPNFRGGKGSDITSRNALLAIKSYTPEPSHQQIFKMNTAADHSSASANPRSLSPTTTLQRRMVKCKKHADIYKRIAKAANEDPEPSPERFKNPRLKRAKCGCLLEVHQTDDPYTVQDVVFPPVGFAYQQRQRIEATLQESLRLRLSNSSPELNPATHAKLLKQRQEERRAEREALAPKLKSRWQTRFPKKTEAEEAQRKASEGPHSIGGTDGSYRPWVGPSGEVATTGQKHIEDDTFMLPDVRREKEKKERLARQALQEAGELDHASGLPKKWLKSLVMPANDASVGRGLAPLPPLKEQLRRFPLRDDDGETALMLARMHRLGGSSTGREGDSA